MSELTHETQTPALVYVDLSHGESTNRVAIAFEDCSRVPMLGDLVDARDPDRGEEATAEVVGLDERERIIKIAIDWTTLRSAS